MGWLEVGAQSHRSEFSHAVFQDLFDAFLGVSGTGTRTERQACWRHTSKNASALAVLVFFPTFFHSAIFPLNSETGAQLAALSPEALRRRMWDAVHELIAPSFHDPTVLTRFCISSDWSRRRFAG